MSIPTTPGLNHNDDSLRDSYNAAFCRMELGWYWDADTYRSLLPCADGRELLRAYVERHRPHLLRAYHADGLIDAIESVRGGSARY
jgi:hypothetical protein